MLDYIGSVCKQIPGQGPAAAARDPAPFLLAKSWLTEDFVIEVPLTLNLDNVRVPGMHVIMNAPSLPGTSHVMPAARSGLEELSRVINAHVERPERWGTSPVIVMCPAVDRDETSIVELCDDLAKATSIGRTPVQFCFVTVTAADAQKWNFSQGEASVYKHMKRESLEALARVGYLFKYEPKDENNRAHTREFHGNFICQVDDEGYGWVLVTSARLTNAAWRGPNGELGVLHVRALRPQAARIVHESPRAGTCEGGRRPPLQAPQPRANHRRCRCIRSGRRVNRLRKTTRTRYTGC